MGRYTELKQVRSQFLEITGVPVEEFDHYVAPFQVAYTQLFPPEKAVAGQPHRRWPGIGRDGALAQIEDKLLFIWMVQQGRYDRTEPGSSFGMGQMQTKRWISLLSPVLQLAFEKLSTLDLPPNCVSFLQKLNAWEVAYLVVGGYAVALHGYLRPILDLDIFIATDYSNAQKMVRVLEAFGEVSGRAVEFFQMAERVISIGQPPFQIEWFDPNDRRIQLGTNPIQLEVLTTISAVTFAECYPARIRTMLSGTPVPVISLEYLKRNKQASIRRKDADDFTHLSL